MKEFVLWIVCGALMIGTFLHYVGKADTTWSKVGYVGIYLLASAIIHSIFKEELSSGKAKSWEAIPKRQVQFARAVFLGDGNSITYIVVKNEGETATIYKVNGNVGHGLQGRSFVIIEAESQFSYAWKRAGVIPLKVGEMRKGGLILVGTPT